MNHAQATQFTYGAARRKCPSCGDQLRLAGGCTFCEREHGSRVPWWVWDEDMLPAATRTASPGRFTISGEDGFWNVLSHMHAKLQHAGPPGGSVTALLKRYNSVTPTAVVFVRQKKRPTRKKKRKVAATGRPIAAFIKALERKRTASHMACDCARQRSSICFTPGCGRKHLARGLCSACHKSARILIANGGAAWGELEDYGLSAPKLHVHQAAPEAPSEASRHACP
jgi:hypothetical protein